MFRLGSRIESLLGKLVIPESLGWIRLNFNVADLEWDNAESPPRAGKGPCPVGWLTPDKLGYPRR